MGNPSIGFPNSEDTINSMTSLERFYFSKGYTDYLEDQSFAIAVKQENLRACLCNIQDIISRLNYRGQSESLTTKALIIVREEQITDLSGFNKLSRLLDSKCQAENIVINVKREVVKQFSYNPDSLKKHIPDYLVRYETYLATLERRGEVDMLANLKKIRIGSWTHSECNT